MAVLLRINVYASLPLVVEPGADLDLNPANWPWVHCLTLPLETLNAVHLSRRPYRWIHYAIGVIVGARGILYAAPSSSTSVDLDFAGPLTESADLYYYISDDEKRRMFPVDPDIGRTQVTSSVHTARGFQFHDAVAERDARRCVLANMSERNCDAVHLLAHSKGDTYISTFTRHRSRDPTKNDIIDDIDDVRNGLSLNVLTHRWLGTAVAFLMTPNFAMDTTDIDPIAPPQEERCTAHTFQLHPDPYVLGDKTLHSGSPLRMSHSPDWPPAILFDAVYASAVLHNFGTQELRDAVTKVWEDSFDPDEIITGVDTDHKVNTDERTLNQTQERQEHYEAFNGPDTFDMLLALPYVLVPPAMARAAKEKAEAEEQRRVWDKVDTWCRQVTTE